MRLGVKGLGLIGGDSERAKCGGTPQVMGGGGGGKQEGVDVSVGRGIYFAAVLTYCSTACGVWWYKEKTYHRKAPYS